MQLDWKSIAALVALAALMAYVVPMRAPHECKGPMERMTQRCSN